MRRNCVSSQGIRSYGHGKSWLRAIYQELSDNKRVRKELGQYTKDEGLENLQFQYDVLVDVIEGEHGFNPGIFDAAIPTASHVERANTEAEQVEDLHKAGEVFSASGQWNFCESRIGGNAGVTIKAKKKQLEINELARQRVANKKDEAHHKALERTQNALLKFEFDNASMNDKNWCDVIRWVLPEAKVVYLLKDLKKKEQILARLQTLPNQWTTYIPRREVVTTIPTATAVYPEQSHA